MIVHAAILVATLPGGQPGPAQPIAQTPLRASLVPADVEPQAGPEVPAPVPPVLTAMQEQSNFTVPAPERAVPATQPPTRRAARAGLGSFEIAAEPLADRSRLGGILARQMNEFPAEVDRPVRMDDRIVARFPASALAQGREDVVAVWVIVDASGNVEDVRVAEGSEEFAEEVVAAVRAARFHPAEDNLKPIRFPISLQFDFRARAAATAQAK